MKFDEILMHYRVWSTVQHRGGDGKIIIIGQKSWYGTCWYDPTPHRIQTRVERWRKQTKLRGHFITISLAYLIFYIVMKGPVFLFVFFIALLLFVYNIRYQSEIYINPGYIYCMSTNSWPNLYSNWLYKMGLLGQTIY